MTEEPDDVRVIDVADDEDPDSGSIEERPAWSRWVIIGAALVAVLLIGATLGMVITRFSDDSSPAAATPAAGSVEVGFAQDMSTHHLQAVTMANWARDHSTDQEVRQLAFDIQSTQLEQVGRMKGWLMLWGQPEQAIGPYMAWMTEPMAGMTMASAKPTPGAAPMPGMATDAELVKLRSLTGKAMDVYFLQLMLRHHEGGTAMAEYASAHSSLPALKQLVNSMLTSQGAEMTLMKQLLAARGASPLPAP